jgi:hypothetical protein
MREKKIPLYNKVFSNIFSLSGLLILSAVHLSLYHQHHTYETPRDYALKSCCLWISDFEPESNTSNFIENRSSGGETPTLKMI